MCLFLKVFGSKLNNLKHNLKEQNDGKTIKANAPICQNETIRQILRLSIRHNVRKHCKTGSPHINADSCNHYIYRVVFESINSKLVSFANFLTMKTD